MSKLGIAKTEEIAAYMRHLFKAQVRGNDNVPMPSWPIELLEDCRYAVKVIVNAVSNPSKCYRTWGN